MLTHISEDGSLEAIDRFLQLVRPNYLAPSCVIPPEPGLESFSKKPNEVGLFILNFLLRILEVLSNATPGGIHGSP